MSVSIIRSAQELSPAATPQRLLAALRSKDATLREAARETLAYSADHLVEARHVELRAATVRHLAGALRPSDHLLLRWLVEQETAAHAASGHGASEALYILVAALARYTDPADALIIWRARNTTPETRAGVDVEQALRAGVERVRRHLTRLVQKDVARAAEASRALAWVEAGVAGGAADDLPAYFAWSDERFGLHIDCPTCRFAAPIAGLPAE
jgi:hypothetical protein